MSAAAYFDVDGTLCGTNLLHPTAFYLANQATPRQSISRLGKALLGGPAMALAEMRDRRLFNELLYGNFKGMTEDRMVCLADEVYRKMVKPRVFEGAKALIDKCHEAELRVVFVTGSLDYTIVPLARELGVDPANLICNKLEFKTNVATGKILRPVVAGPTKSRLIAEDARAHGHDLADCHGYSDSYSDVPMLSVVGHPHCINPDKALRRLANAYDWPILDIDKPGREERVRS